MASPEPVLEENPQVSFDCAWGCAPVWIQHHMSQRSHALQPTRGGTLYVSNLAYEMSQARLQQLIQDKADVSVVSAAADWGLLLPIQKGCQINSTATNYWGQVLLLQVQVELIKRGKPERLHNAGMAIVTLEQGTDIAKCTKKLQQVVQDGRPLAVSTEKFL